jgi:AraC family transcriptional activator of mtrCDE
MDWLSHLLDISPVRGQLDIRCSYAAPWRLDEKAAGSGEIPYHLVLAGSAVLEDPAGGPPQRLEAGDILLIPDGGAHVLHDGSGLPPQAHHESRQLNLVVSENHGNGERLELLCGRFVLTAPHDRLLRDYLSSRLIVRGGGNETGHTATGAQLLHLVSLMRSESAADRIGGRALLDALSTAMFALTLRLASESASVPTGWLALAANARLQPALMALFQQPARPWTLPELADRCHMSRATLARQFQETLGRSPNDLLTDIRMSLAAAALKQTSASTGAVAESVGYQSEAAFQRVFKQRMGMTPARWRRQAQAIAR